MTTKKLYIIIDGESQFAFRFDHLAAVDIVKRSTLQVLRQCYWQVKDARALVRIHSIFSFPSRSLVLHGPQERLYPRPRFVRQP